MVLNVLLLLADFKTQTNSTLTDIILYAIFPAK